MARLHLNDAQGTAFVINAVKLNGMTPCSAVGSWSFALREDDVTVDSLPVSDQPCFVPGMIGIGKRRREIVFESARWRFKGDAVRPCFRRFEAAFAGSHWNLDGQCSLGNLSASPVIPPGDERRQIPRYDKSTESTGDVLGRRLPTLGQSGEKNPEEPRQCLIYKQLTP